MPDIIYPTIKEIASFEALTYYSRLKKSQTLYLFYKTTRSGEMLYMVHVRPYSSAKTVLILLDRGLRPNFSRFLIAHLEAIHLMQEVPPFMPASVCLKTSSRPWAGGPPKLGKSTFGTTPPFVLNYNSPPFVFASTINSHFPLTATRFYLSSPPPSPTLNIISLS